MKSSDSYLSPQRGIEGHISVLHSEGGKGGWLLLFGGSICAEKINSSNNHNTYLQSRLLFLLVS